MTSLPIPAVVDYVYDGAFVSNHDGDTVRLSLDVGFGITFGGIDTFRVLGIQAPEVAGPGVSDAEKAAGNLARLYMLSLVSGEPLVVRTEKDQREGHGRYLARFWRARDGLDVSQAMLDAGHAAPAVGDGKVAKWQGVNPNGGYRWKRADGSLFDTPPVKPVP